METIGQWRDRKTAQWERIKECFPDAMLERGDYDTRFAAGFQGVGGIVFGQLEKRDYVPLGWDRANVEPGRFDQDGLDLSDEEVFVGLTLLQRGAFEAAPRPGEVAGRIKAALEEAVLQNEKRRGRA